MIRKLALVAILTGAATAAFAQQGSSDEQTACRRDVRKFCHNKEVGEIAGCLLSQPRKDLSATCRALLKSKGV